MNLVSIAHIKLELKPKNIVDIDDDNNPNNITFFTPYFSDIIPHIIFDINCPAINADIIPPE